MSVKITITNAGTGISSTLDVYTNTGGGWIFFSNVSLSTLETGYTFTPPVDTTSYQVRDLGYCSSILELNCTTTSTTTLTPTTSTTTSTTTEVPTVYTYFGISPYSYYITELDACNDVSCSADPPTGCSSYYSYNNTLNPGDSLYDSSLMSTPIWGDYFYFSMALTTSGTIAGPKMVVQIDNSGVIQTVSTC